jgi:hypothetical protein
VTVPDILLLQALPEERVDDRPAVETGTLSIEVWTCCALQAADTNGPASSQANTCLTLVSPAGTTSPELTLQSGRW